MNLGIAIFLSSIFLGSIWLYYITRDRWNWKKIFKWFGIIVLSIGIILSGVLIYKSIIKKEGSTRRNEVSNDNLRVKELKEFRREKLTILGDFELGITQSEVKFLFGKPQIVSQKPEVWVYQQGLDKYLLYFIDKKIISITEFFYSDFEFESTEEVIMKWGEPTERINFADDFKKLFLYKDYNLFLTFYKNKVLKKGIYLPQYENEVKKLILSQHYF
jgi:hypothetical protein